MVDNRLSMDHVQCKRGTTLRTALVSEYRKKLSQYHKSILRDHEPLVIKVPGEDDVVILARSDYESLEETIYILQDKATIASIVEGRARNAGGSKPMASPS